MPAPDFVALVALAHEHGASDLHLQPGLPATVRVNGELHPVGESLSAADLAALTEQAVGEAGRAQLVARRSADVGRELAGVRCRINAAATSRGWGLAVRLLARQPLGLAALNLLPDLGRLVEHTHGLVIVSGPTGCGKSSTLAGLVHEINRRRTCHVLTLEQPVEALHRPQRAFIRQREVGRDTPSFQQGLLDALREDIDVLLVGEMRDRETMRLTLDACETGHLVLATLHSGSTIDALQRMVSAFPADEQASVCAQLADVLIGVVAQRLVVRDELGVRVPECEVLVGSTAARAVVRMGQLHKLSTVLQTGAEQGQWTRERYRRWLDERSDWTLPERAPGLAPEPRDFGSVDALAAEPAGPVELDAATATAWLDARDDDEAASGGAATSAPPEPGEVIRIDPPEGSLSDVLADLERERRSDD